MSPPCKHGHSIILLSICPLVPLSTVGLHVLHATLHYLPIMNAPAKLCAREIAILGRGQFGQGDTCGVSLLQLQFQSRWRAGNLQCRRCRRLRPCRLQRDEHAATQPVPRTEGVLALAEAGELCVSALREEAASDALAEERPPVEGGVQARTPLGAEGWSCDSSALAMCSEVCSKLVGKELRTAAVQRPVQGVLVEPAQRCGGTSEPARRAEHG
mmetsp:Transcript_49555/g.117991  ORF Transcript_49555/g.117991 Transcript_49555/m.117991 type:complete len:214 (-) Transcript_49555:736-1377(-)